MISFSRLSSSFAISVLAFGALTPVFTGASAHAQKSQPARDPGRQRGAGANPRGQKEQALARLLDVQADIAAGAPGVGDAKHAREEIADAVERLELSLAPDLWLQDDEGNIDPQRLDPEEGHHVFNQERHAAQEAFDAIRQGKITDDDLRAELLAIVDLLVVADRRLADVAIEDAQAAVGDAERVDEALAQLADGDRLVDEAAASDNLSTKAARLYEAMDNSFRHAWDAAIDAVEGDGG